MNIWTFHCYGTLPEHGQMTRHYNFGKNYAEMGHKPVVFVGSHPHNTSLQLIEGSEKFKVYQELPFPWVLIKTNAYQGNKIKRIWSMVEFQINAKKAVKHFEKPDVIIGSSATPMVAALGVRLARKYKARSIVEVRDLWPESLVSYGVAGENSPVVRIMRRLEKWLYKNADAVVFLMNGAYDYIVKQGWEKDVPKEKVHFIDNGVDLERYDYEKEHCTFEDSDLDDCSTYKVVYTGSLRKANASVLFLLEAVKLMQGPEYADIRFLLYGAGELVDVIRETCEANGYTNVIIKGEVSKKYIPYVLSKCDLNILNCKSSDVLQYGGSQNKLFEYFASGHPTIAGENPKRCLVATEGCGISKNFQTGEELRDAIMEMKKKPIDADHIRSVSRKYDFKELTKKYMCALTGDRSKA